MRATFLVRDLKYAVKILAAMKRETRSYDEKYVRLIATGNKLFVERDLPQTSARIALPCNVEAAGKVVVFIPELLSVIGSADADVGALENNYESPSKVKFSFDEDSCSIDNVPDNDKPVKDEPGIQKAILGGGMFQYLMQCALSVMTDGISSDGHFSDLCKFEITNGSLSASAGNPHRVVLFKEPKYESPTVNISCLIPYNMALIVARAGKKIGDVTLAVTDNHVLLTVDNISVRAHRRVNQFPNAEKFINDTTDVLATAVVNTDELLGKIKRMQVFSKKNKYNTLRLNVDNDSMTVSSVNYDDGSVLGTTSLPCGLDGEPLHVLVNAKYLAEILSIPTQETVRITFFKKSQLLLVNAIAPIGFTGVLALIKAKEDKK